MHPSETPVIEALWNGFVWVVLRVLIGLARSRIVFFNFRPGYDGTENVLVRQNDDGSVDMALIDYESLIEHEYVDELPVSEDGRYQQEGEDAFTSLFLQILLLGSVWATKTSADDVDAAEILDDLGRRALLRRRQK